MLTSKQIAALKYIIFNTKDGNDLSKQILAFLIDQSEGLTKEVCLTLVQDREGYTADELKTAISGIHRMQSCNGMTHFNEVVPISGSELNFSFHYGDFDSTRTGDPFSNAGQCAGWDPSRVLGPNPKETVRKGMLDRYTFWLSKQDCSRQATLVTATRKELEQIDLRRPGLYSFETSMVD